ncbi:hypothetical protein Trydic_g3324 [Trypoxylus dichotomus]
MGLDRASSQFRVTNSTLGRYVKKRRENPAIKIKGKFEYVFTDEQDLEFVTYLKGMEKQLFDLGSAKTAKWPGRIGWLFFKEDILILVYVRQRPPPELEACSVE